MDKDTEKLLLFVEEACNSKTNYRKIILSDYIPAQLTTAILDIYKIDVSEYKNEIYEQVIRHIVNRHGEYGTADQSMANMENWKRIHDFLINFDEILPGNEKGSSQFKNSDGTNGKTIQLQKNYPNETGYLVEAVPVNKNRSLEVVTMFFIKK